MSQQPNKTIIRIAKVTSVRRMKMGSLVGTPVVAALLAVGAAACTSTSPNPPKATAPDNAPSAAVKVVSDALSRDLAVVRNTLVPQLASRVNASTLAPAGTRVVVQPHSWRQYGDDASLRAIVTVPRHPAVTEVFYLIREEGKWRILFTDAP
jgi:hypothetical protein